MNTIDLDMLATDIADLLNRSEYSIDATADAIRPELDALLARIETNTAREHTQWENSGDAATWTATPAHDTTPTIQAGPAPTMTYTTWRSSQNVDLGQTATDAHYWRCPVCRAWAGPYSDVMTCKRAGMDHRLVAHDMPAAWRTEARKAARKVAGPAMTAATFDAMSKRTATTHATPVSTVHHLVSRIASVVAGYSHADDLIAAAIRDGLVPASTARPLILDLAAELGQRERIARAGA